MNRLRVARRWNARFRQCHGYEFREAPALERPFVPSELIGIQCGFNLAFNEKAPTAFVVNHDVRKSLTIVVGTDVRTNSWKRLLPEEELLNSTWWLDLLPRQEPTKKGSILVKADSQRVTQAVLRLRVLVEDVSHGCFRVPRKRLSRPGADRRARPPGAFDVAAFRPRRLHPVAPALRIIPTRPIATRSPSVCDTACVRRCPEVWRLFRGCRPRGRGSRGSPASPVVQAACPRESR